MVLGSLGPLHSSGKKRAGVRCRLDETYFKVNGRWKYFYHTVDKVKTTKGDNRFPAEMFYAIGYNSCVEFITN